MIKLKLKKVLSYSGGLDGKIVVTHTKPFCSVASDEEAEYLVNTGYFVFVEGKAEAPAQGEPENEQEELFAKIDKMNKSDLEAYAAEQNIDISGCKNNDERAQTIKDALAVDENQLQVNFGDGNSQENGSPTMIELQDE